MWSRAPRRSPSRARTLDVRAIGETLHVGTVLEGSVRRTGDRLRVAAQLIEREPAISSGPMSTTGELEDVFAVQDELARAITRQRSSSGCGGTASRRPADGGTEAHDLYLKGRYEWNQSTASSLRRAARYFARRWHETRPTPGRSLGWQTPTCCYPLLRRAAGGDLRQGEGAAEKAIALDSTLAEAHTALAYGTMIYDWDWPRAEASFRRAIAADSTYPTAHQWYGDFLWSRGRLEEALDQMQRAHRLDPLSRVIGSELGQTYYLMRRNDEALKRIQETLALDPNYPKGQYLTGLVHIQQGRYAEAIEEIRRSIELGGFQEDVGGALGYAYGASGDRAAAEKYIAELQTRLAKGTVGPFALALAYTGLGETTRAFEYLNRAIDVRDIFLPEDFFDPLLDALRRDPRFRRVEERMGVR